MNYLISRKKPYFLESLWRTNISLLKTKNQLRLFFPHAIKGWELTITLLLITNQFMMILFSP
jgi:hypothetical protein